MVRTRKFAVVVIVGILTITGIVCTLSAIEESMERNWVETSRTKAFQYLVDSYNSTLGLCYEHPQRENMYWISHDNVLASHVLQGWNRTIADNITETIKELSRIYNLTTSESGVPLDCRAEILLGYQVTIFFNATRLVVLNSSYHDSILGTERANNSIIPDFEDYTDLLCYASLVEWRRRNYSGANYYYEKAKSMWDGNGFKDKAFHVQGYYATYKLGLFYYIHRFQDKEPFEFQNELIDRVWQCQDNNGGFKTDYYANGSFPSGCETSTETTSIILLSQIPYRLLAHPKDVQVGAYYYIWWGIPFNNHWIEDVKGTPFLWTYNSSDPEIADRHILWAKQHGIDFFAVSWLGNWDWFDHRYIDGNLKNGFLEAEQLKILDFCLFYESEIILQAICNASLSALEFARIFTEDIIYAAENYFTHPSYLRIDGKPVLFIHNLPVIYSTLNVTFTHELLYNLTQRMSLYLIGDVGNAASPSELDTDWLYALNATTSYFFSDASKGWNEILEEAKTCYPQWLSFMNSRGIGFVPNAYPGFNNTGLKGVTDPAFLSPNLTRFQEFLTIAGNQTDDYLRMVMITSWNEWLEATAIEPSMESGEDFLHVIPEYSPTLILSLLVILTMAIVISKRKR